MKRLLLVSIALAAVSSVALPVFAEPVIREIPFVKKTTLTVPQTYTFRFSLWDAGDPADLAGTMVWSEEETIDLSAKKIRHDLGSVESLGGVDFSRQLWVQVDRWKKKTAEWAPVGPRVMLRVVPYALFSEAVGADVITSGEILDGTVAAADLEDGAALGEILDDDGSGSGLDADTVDGLHANDLEESDELAAHAAAADAHHARYSDAGAVDAVKAADGSGSGFDADLLDGRHLEDLDARYGMTPGILLTAFTTSTVDSVGSVGGFTSITIGSDGLPVISYHDFSTGALKVAHCVDAACTSATLSAVEFGVTNVGWDTSITIGADGLPVVSHRDQTEGDLKVAHCVDAACTSATLSTVDSAGNVGWYTSITIGADGLPIVSYHDQTNGDLKVAHCDDAACTSAMLSTVDSAGAVGWYTSITIGADGLPVISYLDLINVDLKVAHCVDAACTSATLSTVDSDGNVGSYTSITIGADGLPIVSYHDQTNGDLKVAHCVDAACTSATLSTVDSGGTVGWFTSVAIGTAGLPIVSYYDQTNQDLKVAHCVDAACTAATLSTPDSAGSVGGTNSITIGADGLPVISYSDGTNGDLKVAHGFVRALGRR